MPQAKQLKCACGAGPFKGTKGLSTHQRLKHPDLYDKDLTTAVPDAKPNFPSPDELSMTLKAQLNGTNDFDTLVQLYTILKDATLVCKDLIAGTMS